MRTPLLIAAGLTGALSMAAPFSAFAAPDAAKGAALFQDRCVFCHMDAGQGQGPNLTGVVGRKAATATGFTAYTDALKGSGLTWTPENLSKFLQGPTDMVPGTTMPMTVPDDAERADLIAYLASKK